MTTADEVNKTSFAVSRRIGETRLGVLKNWEWHDDPRRLAISLSRYKFVAKMFKGRDSVLEVGCGDGFCAPIVRQEVKKLTITDFDPIYIDDIKARAKPAEIVKALAPHGAVIIGMPSLESQEHASPQSKAGHVNCKTEEQLRGFMQRHFDNVFIFAMNDEVVHTGFGPMAHYRLALACDPKR
jgi:protein-L-isoaspartate O-methyltransferase